MEALSRLKVNVARSMPYQSREPRIESCSTLTYTRALTAPGSQQALPTPWSIIQSQIIIFPPPPYLVFLTWLNRRCLLLGRFYDIPLPLGSTLLMVVSSKNITSFFSLTVHFKRSPANLYFAVIWHSASSRLLGSGYPFNPSLYTTLQRLFMWTCLNSAESTSHCLTRKVIIIPVSDLRASTLIVALDAFECRPIFWPGMCPLSFSRTPNTVPTEIRSALDTSQADFPCRSWTTAS